MPAVSIQTADFDPAQLQRELCAVTGAAGAVVTFTGLVRADAGAGGRILHLQLEHYPGMTEASIAAIVQRAGQRWPLLATRVVHRVGKLLPGEQIVYVGVSAAHRAAAFAACEFIMDYLKTRAPFWKKAFTPQGAAWLEAAKSDVAAARRWQQIPE